MKTPTQRLMRSRRDKILGGVAGGIGHYLAVDPVVVRIILVLLGLYGVGIPLYLVLWVVTPLAPQAAGEGAARNSGPQQPGAASSTAAYQAFVAGGSQRKARFHPMTGEPIDPDEEIPVRNLQSEPSSGDTRMRRNWLLGAILLGVGVLLMIKMLMPGLMPLLIPGLLIGGGVYLLYRNQEEQQQTEG